jgi:hypothetical protein
MRRLAIVVLGAAAACGAQAQMYKWVDEDGRVQYTQTPPPPGRPVQPIKPAATQPAARPEPAGKSAGAASPPGAEKPAAGKGKATAKSGDKEEVISPDAKRLFGEWRTHPGARVQVKFQLQQDGTTLRTGQAWAVGATTHVTSGMKVVVSGAKGAGTLSQDTAEKLPSSLRYELRGDGLILTVDSGPFAGTHLLTRSQ